MYCREGRGPTCLLLCVHRTAASKRSVVVILDVFMSSCRVSSLGHAPCHSSYTCPCTNTNTNTNTNTSKGKVSVEGSEGQEDSDGVLLEHRHG